MNTKQQILDWLDENVLTGVPDNVSAAEIRQLGALLADRQYSDSEILVTASSISAGSLDGALEELLALIPSNPTIGEIVTALEALTSDDRLSYTALKDKPTIPSLPASVVDFAAFVANVQTMSNGSIEVEPDTPISLECYPAAQELFSQVRWTVFQTPADYQEILYGSNVTIVIPTEGMYNVNCQLLKQDGSVVAEKIVGDFIEVAEDVSTTKSITSFIFEASLNAGLSEDQVCSINQVTGAITKELPEGVSLNGLIPTIVHNGESINPASGVAQDFSSEFTYRVTAEDASTKDYDVNLTVAQGELPIYHGYRTSGQGELLSSDGNFEDIVTGVQDASQQTEMTDASPELISIDFTAYGIDQFTQSWHWFAVPDTVSDYQWCDWVGNLGTPKDISTKIKTSDPESVTIGGNGYKLYRLLFDVSANWTFSVNEIS